MTQGHALGPRFVSAVLLFVWLARGSSAQPIAPPVELADLRIPGGIARLFHAASLPAPRDRGYALLVLSRLIYQEPLGGKPALDVTAARLRDYVDVLGQWCIRTAPFSGGIVLRDAAARTTRGQLEELLAFIGLVLKEDHGGYRVEPHGDPDAPRRRASLSAAGIPLEDIERRLNAGATVDLTVPGDVVPLPLAEAAWLRAVFENRVPREALFALIVGEREALWLYGGLLGLDPETRRFLEQEPALLAWIYRNRPALFGAFGRSLRVGGGQVETPGGVPCARLWESLVGVPAAEPVRFVRALLERDGGRLAWFYDTVAHLPGDRQSVVAAAFTKDTAARVAWFRSLYSAFLAFHPSWNVAARPFVRRSLDPTLALHVLAMRPDGGIAGPPWASFWEEALANGELPDQPSDAFKHLESDRVATLPWVLGQVFGRPITEHRALFDLVLFAGRVFGTTGQAGAFDALVALRGFGRFPALMLTLEHLGVRNPEVYAEAARAATLISASGGARPVAVRTTQFQAAVALLDRLREVHALDLHAAETLARGLFAARLSSDGWYQGAIASWLDRQVVPALGGADGAESAEGRVMMALAGMPRVPGPSGPVIEWEGQRYQVDLVRPVLARLLQVREKQGGPDLDSILIAWRAATAAANPDGAGAKSPALAVGADPMDVPQASALLGSPLPDTEPLLRRVDWLTAEWLASLAYAVRIENVDAAVLLGGNAALAHDLGIATPRLGQTAGRAWEIPAEAMVNHERTHLVGSLLCLALPLARYATTRLKTEVPGHPPTVHEKDAAVFTASFAALNPLDANDEERDRVAGALRRGRARISALCGDPRGWGAIAGELSADEWEREVIPWMLAHECDRVSARFSAHDLFVLGADGAPTPPDHWGMIAQPVDGSLFLRLPAPALRRVLVNQGGVGVLVTQLCDLHFRVSEFLAESHLPASIGRAVLAAAVPEFLERAVLSYDSDWPGLVVAAMEITNEQLEEYVSALTVDGPLVRDASSPSAMLHDPRIQLSSRRCP